MSVMIVHLCPIPPLIHMVAPHFVFEGEATIHIYLQILTYSIMLLELHRCLCKRQWSPSYKEKAIQRVFSVLVHTCIGIISLTDENDVMSDVTINFSQSIQILFHNIQYMKINTKKIEILPGDCNEISNYYYIEFYSIIQWKQFYIKFFQNLPLLARFI